MSFPGRQVFSGCLTDGQSLGEAVTGIDDRNFALLIKSVWHAPGRRRSG